MDKQAGVMAVVLSATQSSGFILAVSLVISYARRLGA